MTIENIEAAKANLESLIEKAVKGEEIIISQEGQQSVKLVPVETDAEQKLLKPREPGSLKGKIWMADDFNETPEEIIKLFYGEEE